MIKGLILAAHRRQAIFFIRHFNLNANDYRYIDATGGYGDVYGYHWDTPVITLERYYENKNYTLEFMSFVGHRFNNIGHISEGEMYNDN